MAGGSDITTWCTAYKAGQLTFEELTARLVAFPFVTAKGMLSRPPDEWERADFADEYQFEAAPGSLMELSLCWAHGLLTNPEYEAIKYFIAEAHGETS